jgi:hypothetical protein
MEPNDLPPMCVYGASIKTHRGKLFSDLKAIWKQRAQQAENDKGSGVIVNDKMLCSMLKEQYETVNAQRISQWATGTDPAALCPDHILAFMCHILGLAIVFAPSGLSLHEYREQE